MSYLKRISLGLTSLLMLVVSILTIGVVLFPLALLAMLSRLLLDIFAPEPTVENNDNIDHPLMKFYMAVLSTISLSSKEKLNEPVVFYPEKRLDPTYPALDTWFRFPSEFFSFFTPRHPEKKQDESSVIVVFVFLGNGIDHTTVANHNVLGGNQEALNPMHKTIVMPPPLSKLDGVRIHRRIISKEIDHLRKENPAKAIKLSFRCHSLGGGAGLAVLSDTKMLKKLEGVDIDISVMATFKSMAEFISPFHGHSGGVLGQYGTCLFASFPLLSCFNYRNVSALKKIQESRGNEKTTNINIFSTAGEDDFLGTNDLKYACNESSIPVNCVSNLEGHYVYQYRELISHNSLEDVAFCPKSLFV